MAKIYSGKYWNFNFTKKQTELEKVKKLRKEREKLEKELVTLRERDVLKAQIGRAKTEEFYRSGTGKAVLSLKGISSKIKMKAPTPQERKTISKNLMKIYKKFTK